MSQVILTCKAVKFHSMLDEDAFFYSIKQIPSIIKYYGIHDELYLYIKSKNISNKDLRDLLGLFHRYKIGGMHQFQVFLTHKNEKWFKNPKWGFWFKKVWLNKK